MSQYGKWEPIETAPKDGTIIILTDGRQPHVGYWGIGHPYAHKFGVDETYPWAFVDGTGDCNAWMSEPRFGPTHWTPFDLPPPPSRTEGE